MSQNTFSHYKKTAAKYTQLPIGEERRLIRLAKKGDIPARKTLLLHLMGFFIYRIETTLFPLVRREYGEDILQECFIFAAAKIKSYRPRYKDKNGVFKKIKFSTYLWKGVTGLMFTHIKKNSMGKTVIPISTNFFLTIIALVSGFR